MVLFLICFVWLICISKLSVFSLILYRNNCMFLLVSWNAKHHPCHVLMNKLPKPDKFDMPKNNKKIRMILRSKPIYCSIYNLVVKEALGGCLKWIKDRKIFETSFKYWIYPQEVGSSFGSGGWNLGVKTRVGCKSF